MMGYGPGNTPLERFSVNKLWNTILKALNLEKGIFYTIVNLLIRPGVTLNTYLFEDRTKMVKPLSFILLTTAIAAFLTVNFIDLESAFGGIQALDQSNAPALDEKTQAMMDEFNRQYAQSFNIILLISVPFLALGSYIFYKKAKYHFAEHLVISAYLTGMMNSFYVILFPLFMNAYFMASAVYILCFVAYASFAFIQLFQERLFIGILKGIGIQVFYYTAFMFVVVLFLFVIGLVLVLGVRQ